PAALPGHDLELVAARGDHDRLHDALLANRGGQVREAPLREGPPRLVAPRDEAVDLDLLGRWSTWNSLGPRQEGRKGPPQSLLPGQASLRTYSRASAR